MDVFFARLCSKFFVSLLQWHNIQCESVISIIVDVQLAKSANFTNKISFVKAFRRFCFLLFSGQGIHVIEQLCLLFSIVHVGQFVLQLPVLPDRSGTTIYYDSIISAMISSSYQKISKQYMRRLWLHGSLARLWPRGRFYIFNFSSRV